MLNEKSIKYASLVQSVEQRTVNPYVVGSSPTRGANRLTELNYSTVNYDIDIARQQRELK